MPRIDKKNHPSNNNLKRKYNKSNWKRKKEKFLWREEPSEKRRFLALSKSLSLSSNCLEIIVSPPRRNFPIILRKNPANANVFARTIGETMGAAR